MARAFPGGRGGNAEPLTLKQLRTKALDLLTRRDHSEKELEDKLRSRGGREDDVAQLLLNLRDIGLLDDRRYARSFLLSRSGKAWGRQRFRQELIARGIPAEMVAEVLLEAQEDDGFDPSRKLSSLVERALSRGRDPQKIIASLLRRGFAYPEIREALAEYTRED